MRPTTLGQLKRGSRYRSRSVKEEMRQNLIRKLEGQETLFDGIVGFDETVVPAILNALLSRHDFILLGLRGQAKSRILRLLTEFLDDNLPFVEGCEVHDDPLNPICGACQRRLAELGDDLPIAYWPRPMRYVEKLATPDVTIADILGDLDPIKAARSGHELSALENIHFGLLPRAHRGIFAINELPDLAPKIQVGLLNILQEGDVQIKGFPVRLPLDVLMVFTANPEDYTARGKIITPLKDRIGAEVRTHYPRRLDLGIQITRQESWVERGVERPLVVPEFVEEIIESIAFLGRRDNRIDHRSGISQRLPITCLESAISNAERRALIHREELVAVRVGDVHASLPAITGKLELEYEGELKGAESIGRELIQMSVLKSYGKRFRDFDFDPIVQWFELGGQLMVDDQTSADEFLQKIREIRGLEETLAHLGGQDQPAPVKICGIELILEGLTASQKISRNEEKGYFKGASKSEADLIEHLSQRRGSFN